MFVVCVLSVVAFEELNAVILALLADIDVTNELLIELTLALLIVIV
jgi:hypothetical protein